MPLQNYFQWNEHSPHLSGILSASFDHYCWLLRSALNLHVYFHGKKTGAIVNDYMPLPKWILSQSFGDTFGNFRPLSLTTLTCVNHIYYWLLRTRAIANLEAIMLMNTLVILRVTFGNFRTLSLTTSACVNLQIDLLLDLLITSDASYRNLLNTIMLMNSLAILLCTVDNFFWPLRLLSIFI